MTQRPTGTVTFLFTDMEGSTRAWEAHPTETGAALQRHDKLVADCIATHQGTIILERGEGDSVFAVFARASDAAAAACAIQRAIRKESWPAEVPLRVRMAIHTGEAGADYRGPHVNRAARIRAIGHGEQILISSVTAGIVRGTLPDGASLIDLGQHRLRDVSEMEHVFQLAHPELRADFPPLKSLSNVRQNLPVQLTSFVGRARERETVRALIHNHRVVTLCGSGGCGKTRLAIQVGADELENFPDGVRFVDLAPMSESSLVVDAIAGAIGAKIEQGVSTVDALVRTLEGTKTLIILDNCEHLISACAEAVSALVRSGEGVRMLATSREPLGLPGEMMWRVPSLSLPESATNIEGICACEAVQLFVDRAAAARQGFALTETNAEAITQICRTLEGVPLAIELAAARAKALAPREIRDRLSDRFRLLTGGHGRHQTLRSTIDWSYDLLPEKERALFRLLCVFAGGFDLSAAQAVWPEGDPLDHIEPLVDKSLVTVEQLSDETLRYRLQETLRQYGAERLAEAGEEEDARERHFAHCLAVAERAYAQRIEEEASSLALLETNHDDFRAALRWVRSRPRDLLRLASALGWFWHLRSHYREGRGWLEEALALNPAERSRETARALWALSMILNWSGEVAAARPLADQSLALWRENGDPLELALALESIGYSQFMAGEYSEALRSMEDCLESYRKLGSAKLITRGRVAVGQMLVALGDVERTEPLARETLAEGRAQGEAKFVHFSLHYLGDCALWRGDASKAVAIYGESLRAALDYGNEMEAATEMQGMAMGLAGSGKEEEGFCLYGASCARFAELQTTAVDEIAFWLELRGRYLPPARERIGAA
ncbi:MAG: tetratricopeptide repeat protein, partial [Chthoniobacterales bacterium]|nr:tetratricopeptide repeat protein [Chthoniobacterales bacterium]